MGAKRRTTAFALALLIALLPACSGDGNRNNEAAENSNNEPSRQVVQLKAITMGEEPSSGLENLYKQLDELTIRDLNVVVRFDFVPWSDEKNQISRAIVAKEYDLYVGGVWSDFSSFAAKNAFVDLAPLLDQVPGLVNHYGDALERVMMDGKLFGIPQLNKPGAGGEGVLFREDLRKQWGLPQIKDLTTLEAYLFRAKEEYKSVSLINDKRFIDNLWTIMAGGEYYTVLPRYAVAPVDDPYRIISMYDTPEYKIVVTKAKEWYEEGIIDPRILSGQANETGKTLELMKADLKPLEFNNHFGAVSVNYIGALKTLYPEYEYGWYDFLFDTHPTQVFLPQLSVGNSTMISIGAHSEHIETALKFIELAHTNQTYYNLLQFGVEGENYRMKDGYVSYDGIEERNKKPGWTGQYDGYMNPQERYPPDWQAQYDKLVINEGPALAEQNGPSPYEGFAFNSIKLAEESAAMDRVQSQYVLPLAVGMSENIDRDLNEVREQFEQAGMKRYLKELQAQLNVFAAGKLEGKEMTSDRKD
jgi:putative aldouronate transport system substrate-binding protein